MNTEVRIFGYLVAIADMARSLGSDWTKIVKINTAILAAYWTRLLAATTVNRGPSDAHPDLPQVGDGGQLLWADALSRKGVWQDCMKLFSCGSSYDFRDWLLQLVGRPWNGPVCEERRISVTLRGIALKRVHTLREQWLIVVKACSVCPLGHLQRKGQGGRKKYYTRKFHVPLSEGNTLDASPMAMNKFADSRSWPYLRVCRRTERTRARLPGLFGLSKPSTRGITYVTRR